MNGRPNNPAAEFLSKVMGLAETPYGMISREWVTRQMQMGSQAIYRCRNHRPPNCHCWARNTFDLIPGRHQRAEDTGSVGRNASTQNAGGAGADYQQSKRVMAPI
jgi:hypothetical protein